jgi:hypothetical protein
VLFIRVPKDSWYYVLFEKEIHELQNPENRDLHMKLTVMGSMFGERSSFNELVIKSFAKCTSTNFCQNSANSCG